jgi:hypothetical protein
MDKPDDSDIYECQACKLSFVLIYLGHPYLGETHCPACMLDDVRKVHIKDPGQKDTKPRNGLSVMDGGLSKKVKAPAV